jgi:bifunctional DNA-binding transcriptional regulator/antitoxin component of YhaV-PrlF toxin-antitoxin module
MGNVRVMERFIRRLTKNSNGTISVTIPVEHAYELGWNKGDSVLISRQGRELLLAKQSTEGDK